MRFLLGVLVGYILRGKHKLLIRFLVTLALVVYVVIPALALLGLSLDVQRERRSRPVQTKVPALKGLTYEDAEMKLNAANLKIRLLATRYDSTLQPGLIIDQTPAPGLAHNLLRNQKNQSRDNYKGLRCAPMNSANYKTVRSSLDCLPRCGLRVNKKCERSSETNAFKLEPRLRLAQVVHYPPFRGRYTAFRN
jgi:PASTA domain-containing protein